MRSSPRRALMACLLGSALVTAACTGDADSEARSDDGALSAPAELEVSLTDDSASPQLSLSFAPSDQADAYLLEFDKGDEPVRVEPDDCSDDACTVALDRLAVAGTSTVTVASVRSDTTSDPSAPVDLPDVPSPPPIPTEWPDQQPVQLAVTRTDEQGRPAVEVVAVPKGQDVAARVADLKAADGVIAVSVAPPVRSLDTETTVDFPAGLTTWQQEALNFDALPAEPRGEGVTIALIDDGIHPNHPNIDQADITQTNAIEPGRDAPGDHATGVASMIVGEHTGVVPGIATGAAIHAYDVYNKSHDENGEVETDIDWSDPARYGAFANAIVQAVDDGADIINISLAATCISVAGADIACPDETLRPAIDYAEENGVMIVAAAGNDGDGAEHCAGTNEETWPAAFGSVVTVGGTTRDGSTWPCSPDKDYIDVLAPAANLQIADSPDGYVVANGTSFATPLVSGLIAAALAEEPDLTPLDIRDALSHSTDENGRLISGAFLQFLGIEMPTEWIIDLTTGQELIPFSVGFYFPQQSAVWREAGRANDPRDPAAFDNWDAYDEQEADPYPWGLPGFEWSFLEPFTVLIGGMLVIDDDGHITGLGDVQFSEYRNRHTVECPEFVDPMPELTFTWDVPVLVDGQLNDREHGDARDGELTLSMGEEATPEGSGTMPDMTILDDSLDECQNAIAEHDTLFTDPAYLWSEVSTWPDKKAALVQRVYQQIIAESPLQIEDGFFPPATRDEGDDSVYSSNGTVDDVEFRLRVGDVDFYQLS